MPIPQLSSLLLQAKNVPLLGNTGRSWLELIRSEAQFELFCRTLRGIPSQWVAWAEDAAVRATTRGVRIDDPLGYRLAALLHGIINLQECKFLLDSIENALRVAALSHAHHEHLEFNDVAHTIPESLAYQNGTADFESFVMGATFYQVSELFARNWNHVCCPRSSRRVSGFWRAFSLKRECRDVHRFRATMKLARSFRNDIAHSRRLFAFHEIEHLSVRLDAWLFALGVDLRSRIEAYRAARPRFLEGLP